MDISARKGGRRWSEAGLEAIHGTVEGCLYHYYAWYLHLRSHGRYMQGNQVSQLEDRGGFVEAFWPSSWHRQSISWDYMWYSYCGGVRKSVECKILLNLTQHMSSTLPNMILYGNPRISWIWQEITLAESSKHWIWEIWKTMQGMYRATHLA